MAISTLVGIPAGVYSTFVIEAKYGFNKTTPLTYVLDTVKGLVLTVLLGGPIFALIIKIFDSVDYAWLYAFGALSVIQVVLMYLAPVLILPMFNSFTPLPEGELRTRIEALASSQQYGISGIYVIDGSKRSTKSNAYFTGLGHTKRIALYDTLIDKHSVDEVVAILAHEIGHCKLGHIRKGIAMSMGSSLMMLYFLSQCTEREGMYQAFGVEGTPLYCGLVLFGFLYAPIGMLLGPLSSWVSRRHEYQADAYAAQATGAPLDLASGLKRLSVDSLANLTPHPLKVWLEYSHPPVLQRISALEAISQQDTRKTQ
ncbi:CAAX prenyl protease 1 [Kipferlia bialata]|uniref:CAAX prenyl protease n=1 Tax=Kipferlia bialata TaxID=797122 RepID=A0A9K3D5G5_9EUKA|nr:CAAX prenyl protease 1 [Kipferlia bialata]|eukprot:g11828.t1